MGLRFRTRDSDSPWVDAVWTCTSDQVSEMTSVAGVSWGLVFTHRDGRVHADVTGPGTGAGVAPVPAEATFVGVEFAVGTALRAVPTPALVDAGLPLPDTTGRSFRLDGARWEIPGPDDAEALVERLVRAGAVVRDPLVAELRRGHRPELSGRTVERRFRAATGLTQGAVRQIERARRAANLLAGGLPVADVVTALEFVDEPHLARALRRYIGRTAGQLRASSGGASSGGAGSGGALGLDLNQFTTS